MEQSHRVAGPPTRHSGCPIHHSLIATSEVRLRHPSEPRTPDMDPASAGPYPLPRSAEGFGTAGAAVAQASINFAFLPASANPLLRRHHIGVHPNRPARHGHAARPVLIAGLLHHDIVLAGCVRLIVDGVLPTKFPAPPSGYRSSAPLASAAVRSRLRQQA